MPNSRSLPAGPVPPSVLSRLALLPRAARPMLLWGAALLAASAWGQAPAPAASGPSRAALTVATTRLQALDWPAVLPLAGMVTPWQEAVVSPEGAGGRLVAVNAQVGDKVKKGQALAQLATETLQADLAQTRAGLVEAQAVLAEAQANAQRARDLLPTGVISTQQAQQAFTAEATGRARVDAVKAKLAADELRLAQTRIVAPDDGVISARLAVVGSFAGTGQELFRLIRQQRLEWRAELPASELARVAPGQKARLTTPAGETVAGTVRQVAPALDAATRQALVFIDLAPGNAARAGMHARGELLLAGGKALTLPQSALVLRDGFQFVLRVSADQKVQALKVRTGRRQGDRVEVLEGLAPDAQVVASGGAFLTDGDTVKVVQQAPGLPKGSPAQAAPASANAR